MTVEPKLAKRASWVSILCSFVLSAETWVKLAELAGFTGTLKMGVTVPIIGDTLRTSWAMVGVVDAYVISALVLWTFTTNRDLAAFARKNTYAAALVGVAAQSVYHGATAFLAGAAIVLVVLSVVMGAIPPMFAALGIHMRSKGLIAARTGMADGKLTAGLLNLSLIHAAAASASTNQELRAELELTRETLAAVTAPRVTVTRATATVTPTDTATVTVPDDIRELTSGDTATVTPRGSVKRASVKGAALAWLADNAGDSSDSVLADKVAATFAVSLSTGWRYVRAYRATA